MFLWQKVGYNIFSIMLGIRRSKIFVMKTNQIKYRFIYLTITCYFCSELKPQMEILSEFEALLFKLLQVQSAFSLV